MRRDARALAILFAWMALLAAATWWAQRELRLSSDLRFFLPDATTREERLLLSELREGPTSRVLAVAISGADTETLARVSRELRAALLDDPQFKLIANGEASLDDVPEALLPYRFLMSPTIDPANFDTDHLHAALEARAKDLASPAASFFEPLIARDPTLELLKLVESWQTTQEPHREFDVWFDRAGQAALLLVETQASAFDASGQRAALDRIRAAFTALAPPPVHLEITGAGAFTALLQQQTQGQAQLLGSLATVGMIVLLLIAYRRTGYLLASFLPLASAGCVGLLAVIALFDAVHGITLAFGFTLLGVAQDYPLHLLSHSNGARSPHDTARYIWPSLATGVASTCIAYSTFYFSGVEGLAQLAVLTVFGLAAAGLTTRFVVPHLLEPSSEFAELGWIKALAARFDSIKISWRALAVLVAFGVIALSLQRAPFWQNDLSTLTPVPRELLVRDQALRAELGAADLRYVFAVETQGETQLLQKLETLDAKLKQLGDAGAMADFDHIARYVPSADVQIQRQRALPDAQTLRDALAAAAVGSPFRADAFEPFVADVQSAKSLSPLTLQDLKNTPLAPRAEMFVARGDAAIYGLITLQGVRDAEALRQFAATHADVMFLDLKNISETLVARQRGWILWSLMLASVLLVISVAVSLKRIGRIVRVLAPMLLTTLFVLAALRASGVSLSLFHLISLVLAAGLGLDYALFFEHSGADALEYRRTLHAVLVCAASTLLVFALLAASSIPVLRAIGITVTLGVISNFALALSISRSGHAR